MINCSTESALTSDVTLLEASILHKRLLVLLRATRHVALIIGAKLVQQLNATSRDPLALIHSQVNTDLIRI